MEVSLLCWVNLSEESLLSYSDCGALYLMSHSYETTQNKGPSGRRRLLELLKHEALGAEVVLRRIFLAIRESPILEEECLLNTLTAANTIFRLADSDIYRAWWAQPVLRSAISALDREAQRSPDDEGCTGYSDYFQVVNWAQCLLLLECVLIRALSSLEPDCICRAEMLETPMNPTYTCLEPSRFCLIVLGRIFSLS